MQGTPWHGSQGVLSCLGQGLDSLCLTRVRACTQAPKVLVHALAQIRDGTIFPSRSFSCETLWSRCTVVHRNIMMASASPTASATYREGNHAAMGHYSRLSRSESQRYVTVIWASAEMGFHQPFDMATATT